MYPPISSDLKSNGSYYQVSIGSPSLQTKITRNVGWFLYIETVIDELYRFTKSSENMHSGQKILRSLPLSAYRGFSIIHVNWFDRCRRLYVRRIRDIVKHKAFAPGK